jgi:hypothetical protein
MNSYTGAFRGLLVNCNLTSYNLLVSFRNGTYSLLASASGSLNLKSALSGILLRSTDIPSRANSVAQTFLNGMSSNDFMGIFERGISEAALAWSAGLFQAADTVGIGKTVERPGTMYPLPHLIALIGLYLAYTLVALFVAAKAAGATSPSILVRKAHENPRKVAVLSLLVLRLTNIYPLLADFLNPHDSRRHLTKNELPIELDVLRSTSETLDDMFLEGKATERVWIGLDEVHGRFGLKVPGG